MASKAYKYSMSIETPFSAHQKWDINSKEGQKVRRSLTTKAKVSLVIAVFVVVMVVIVAVVLYLFLPRESAWPCQVSPSRLGRFQSAAVSTDSAPCAPIGRSILERNGSAVDAAIATLVCMGAYNPQSMGLGGGFLMVYYNRTERQAYYMDSRETAPLDAHEGMFQGDSYFKRNGGLSIAVPGELAGYAEAHRQFGRLPWKDLFPPTIEMCRKGFPVSKHLLKAIRTEKDLIIREFPHLRALFAKDNGTEMVQEGDLLQRLTYAETLQTIAEQGKRALYGPSPLADQFLEDLQAAGSIISKVDLQNYSPRMREPAEVRLRDRYTVHGAALPGSGALLGFMLAVLSGYPDLDSGVTRSDQKAVLTYHRVAEAFKFAFAHRSRMEDEDSREMEELLKKLTSPSYADEIRSRIDDTRTHNVSYYGKDIDVLEDSGTAHLSIVAPNGDAVSVTSTVNTYFGSKVLSPSTGVILNNEMDDFSSANVTNYFGLPPTSANVVRPGRRPLSSMTPAIVTDADGDVRLVLGGNGGTGITTGALEVALRNLFLGEDIKQSIDAPRLHHQLIPNKLQYEEPFPQKMIEGLRQFGHEVVRRNATLSSQIIGVARGQDGYLYANSDFRKGGDVDGF